MERPTLLYVEDDPDISEMTLEVLAENYTVDHETDGRRALDGALQHHYSAMVLDRRLPGMDGVSLVRAIRTARITTPILLLTALGAVDDRVDGLDAGANDYLVKPFDFAELLARLRALRRSFAAEAERRAIGDWTFVAGSQAMYAPSGYRVSLTETETALLSVLADSPEHIFSRDELLAAVFHSTDSEVGVTAVETYVHYLRRKVGAHVIETVRGRGYRLGVPE